MPLYEYRCSKCDNLFEELQAFDADMPVCPRCGREVVRIMGTPSFRLKGHGFHDTDYTRLGPKPLGRSK